jgi:hypothetical protein
MSVIRVQILGGLGNQMFQAAAAIALARRLSARLELDTSRLRISGERRFGLGALKVEADIFSDKKHPLERAFNKTVYKTARVFNAKAQRRPTGWRGAIFTEPHHHYAPAFEQISEDCYLRGYFQSPRYFAGAEDAIRAAFCLEDAVSQSALATAATFGEGSVALHVRRGDYLAHSKANAFHGVLNADYYERALKWLEAHAAAKDIYVFSDDADFARQMFAHRPKAQFVAGESEFDDMYLMSKARAHIIANSTFSWWSAWLDARPGSIVIAPKDWFASAATLTHDVRDLYPENWIRL